MTSRAKPLTGDGRAASRLTPKPPPVPCPPVRLAVLVCLLVVLAGAACDHRPRLRARKQQLALLPLGWRRPNVNIDDAGRLVTFAVRDRGGFFVVTPHGRGHTFETVSHPFFAPKSEHVLYWGLHTEDGRKRLDAVVDTTIVPTPINEPIKLVGAAGGTRWAAMGWMDAGPDAGPDPARQTVIVVDGREMGRHAAASMPSFSPDGAHVAWATRDPRGPVTIVVDGAPVRTIEAVPPPAEGPSFDQLASTQYLSDGRLLALVPDGDGWTIFRDDERLATYGYNIVPGSLFLGGGETRPAVVAGSLVTASASPVAVWWERMAGASEQWRVVRDGAAIDGMTCDRYWDTQPPVVSDDGTHVAYVCPTPFERGIPLGRRWVTLDGRRFGTYIESWTLGLSNDGTQVAYGAAESLPVMSWRIFVNGVPRTPPEVLVWRPRFSPDGTHLFWAGGPERGLRRLGIDARIITRFDDIVYGPEFPEPRLAAYVIRRGRKVSRLEVSF